MKKLKKITIIILNWNGWEDTIECLESLYQINYSNYNVILVDNASEDDSLEKIKEYCEGKIEVKSNFFEYNAYNKPIKLIEITKEESENVIKFNNIPNYLNSNEKLILIKNDKNYGFAEGNNIGIKYVLEHLNSDYILLLNNDTVVDKDFLYELIRVAENDPKIGVCGPKTFYYDYEGEKNITNFEGGRINIYKGEAYHITGDISGNPKNVDYIEGSCFLIKREVLNKVGLMDKDYFLYWEETDWCFRIKKENYELKYVPKAKIWHKVNDNLNKTNVYYMARNRFLFMKKNSKNIQMTSFLLYFFFFKFWLRLFGYIFYYKKPKILFYYFKGIIDGLKF